MAEETYILIAIGIASKRHTGKPATQYRVEERSKANGNIVRASKWTFSEKSVKALIEQWDIWSKQENGGQSV